LVVAIMIWDKEQTPSSVAVGLILMVVGIMVFAIGQFIGENKEKALFGFWIVNVWILILIPISCIFNFLQGIMFGHSWTFTPIPQLGNSIGSYLLCWGFYLMLCITVDLLLIKRIKR
ncbi:MAG: XRE family transcriptional regulator, partial [Roseburia sp.]|nr:XRE family transcriptional regulator [Roseburia sp.]